MAPKKSGFPDQPVEKIRFEIFKTLSCLHFLAKFNDFLIFCSSCRAVQKILLAFFRTGSSGFGKAVSVFSCYSRLSKELCESSAFSLIYCSPLSALFIAHRCEKVSLWFPELFHHFVKNARKLKSKRQIYFSLPFPNQYWEEWWWALGRSLSTPKFTDFGRETTVAV